MATIGKRPRHPGRPIAADLPLGNILRGALQGLGGVLGSGARGVLAATLGAPGDIESIARMLLPVDEEAILPGSEDFLERHLPQLPDNLRQPAYEKLGSFGFIPPQMLKGAGLGALKAVDRAMLEGSGPLASVLGAARPAFVVKPQGGQWLSGSVEDAVKPLKQGLVDEGRAMLERGLITPEALAQRPDVMLNKWISGPLTKYVKRDMATPNDPLRALAEQDILHDRFMRIGIPGLADRRELAGFPRVGMGKSPLARGWEEVADMAALSRRKDELKKDAFRGNPWLDKLSPSDQVYRTAEIPFRDLGFDHLTDELRNAINPASGLPRELMLRPESLQRMSVPQAVQHVNKINKWRAAREVEAHAQLDRKSVV